MRAANVAVGSTENILIIGEDGIAAHPNTNVWTSAIIHRNVHQSTRKHFLTFLTWLIFPDGSIPAEFDMNETIKPQGFETFCSYRKALHKQFQENRIHRSKDNDSVVSTLFSGVARNDAQMKQEKGLLTGKDAMHFPYYKAVAQSALVWENTSGSLLALCYLTLCWNLIARMNNVAGILFNHLSVDNNNLNVEGYITKSDQTAKKASDKALYWYARSYHLACT